MISAADSKLLMDFLMQHSDMLQDFEIHKIFDYCYGIRLKAGYYKQWGQDA